MEANITPKIAFSNLFNGAEEHAANGSAAMKRSKTIKREKTVHLFAASSQNLSEYEDANHDNDKDIEKEEQGRTALFYPDFPWGVEGLSGRKSSIVLILFDVLSVLSCLYVAGTVPYVVGFAGVIKNAGQCVFYGTDSETRWLAGLDVITDFVFCCDIVLHFYTARWVLISDGLQRWVLVDDLQEIRDLYLKNEFIYDAFGQIPWHYIDCIIPSAPQELKALRLFRLLKLSGMNRLEARVLRLGGDYRSLRFIYPLIKLIVIIMVFAHWMCCLWFWVGFPDGWTVNQGIVAGSSKLPQEAYYEWITAFYWSITTMTTIGYGDISATTSNERTLAVVTMILGCGMFAWTTGRITSLLTSSSSCTRRFMEKIDELQEFMEARGISLGLRKELFQFYYVKFPARVMFDEAFLLQDIPKDLRRKIYLELFRDVVKTVPLFAMCDEDVQQEICYHLRLSFVSPGSIIMKEDEVPTHLYVVRIGRVELSKKSSTLMIAEKGAIFGENAIFGLSPTGRRTRTACALTMCELCMLSVDDVRFLLEEKKSFSYTLQNLLTSHFSSLQVFVWHSHLLSSSSSCPVCCLTLLVFP
ncbi:hypothetical protein GUITHDRAFT_145771 [Guillardia theta CCMP2712]|uniref:Cyclic nucleotide-binding domain-containing protein n=1 Tax=Guillardia theta (strain CCMP2712) TaxID=905079 RepID=L1IKT5_GUITC|nr:hypothetical protein GUITHDRAFT_145771 [Guillardia theta CCMP2712]EKX36405.1 hypothetical protein GUITHDRAFT_145771 [Guillardia theta CCMP2712]|eukprot:XP_005823385.1 hypothetical protein GUITHDRAFT_145771 [Guillardia theta CCMP2712]